MDKQEFQEKFEEWIEKARQKRETKTHICQELIKTFAKDNKFCPICGNPMTKSGEFNVFDRWEYSLVCRYCHFYHGMEFEKLEDFLMWIVYYGETFEDESP